MSTDYYVYCEDCKEDGGYIFSSHDNIELDIIPFIMKHVRLKCNILFFDEHEIDYAFEGGNDGYISRITGKKYSVINKYKNKKDGVIKTEDLFYHRNMIDLYSLYPQEYKELIERVEKEW